MKNQNYYIIDDLEGSKPDYTMFYRAMVHKQYHEPIASYYSLYDIYQAKKKETSLARTPSL